VGYERTEFSYIIWLFALAFSLRGESLFKFGTTQTLLVGLKKTILKVSPTGGDLEGAGGLQL